MGALPWRLAGLTLLVLVARIVQPPSCSLAENPDSPATQPGAHAGDEGQQPTAGEEPSASENVADLIANDRAVCILFLELCIRV